MGDEPFQVNLDERLTPARERWAEGWERCTVEASGTKCLGLASVGKVCLAHANLPQARKTLDKQARELKLDLRGVSLTSEIFDYVTWLVERHRASGSDRPLNMTFSAGEFPFEADFFGWEFSGGASFHATWFRKKANFGGTIFRHSAWLDGTVFDEDATFENAIFHSEAGFTDSCFRGDANLYKARFEAATNLGGALFCGDLTLTEAYFEGNQWLGPIACLGNATLDRAGFEGSLTLEASGGFIDFASARFADTLTMRLRRSVVSLETVVLARPALIASSRSFEALGEVAETLVEQRVFSRPGKVTDLPRIESLRYANVEALTLANVDMRACQFAGVRSLDRLRLEGDAHFASSPSLRARRRVLAEERRWRANRRDGRRWIDAECEITSPFVQEEETQPRQLASIYRALRKSLEDGKDAPGAADFYYGEMEMRRLSGATPWLERALIWAYWLLSGYGVRASRSALVLLAVIGAFGWLYSTMGFEMDHSL